MNEASPVQEMMLPWLKTGISLAYHWLCLLNSESPTEHVLRRLDLKPSMRRGVHAPWGQSHVGGAQGLFRRNPGWHDRHLGRLWKTEEKPEMLVMGWSDRSWLGLEMFYFLALQFWLLCKWCLIVCQLRRMICNEEPALFGGSLSSHVVLFPQTVWPHGIRAVIVKALFIRGGLPPCPANLVTLTTQKSSSIFCFRRKSRTKQWPGDLSCNPLVTLGLSHRSHCGAVIILRSLAQPSRHVGLSNCSRCGTMLVLKINRILCRDFNKEVLDDIELPRRSCHRDLL